MVKDGDDFAVIIVELKFDITYGMLDCGASSAEKMSQFRVKFVVYPRWCRVYVVDTRRTRAREREGEFDRVQTLRDS